MGAGELDDDKIKILASSGNGNGILALHFVTPDYIANQKNPKLPATLEDFLDTLEYVLTLVKIDNIAIGADYFDDKTENRWHWVVKDITQMPLLTRGLVERGYSDEDIKKFLGGNMIRLFEQVWKNDKDKS
jgi:membrane dipeptidase